MSSCSQNIFALLIDFLIRGVLTLKSKSINKAHIDTNGHTEPYTHRHTHRSCTNVQINANLQENKPTDWFHNTSTPLCVCLWRKPHSHSGWRGGWWWCVWEGGGVFGFLWPGVVILTADFHHLCGWKAHHNPLTSSPPAHVLTLQTHSLTPARKPQRLRLQRSEPPHEHMDCVMKMSELRLRGSSAALMASAVMRHRVAREGCDGSGLVCVQYILYNMAGLEEKCADFHLLNVHGVCRMMVDRNEMYWWKNRNLLSYWLNYWFPITSSSS